MKQSVSKMEKLKTCDFVPVVLLGVFVFSSDGSNQISQCDTEQLLCNSIFTSLIRARDPGQASRLRVEGALRNCK